MTDADPEREARRRTLANISAEILHREQMRSFELEAAKCELDSKRVTTIALLLGARNHLHLETTALKEELERISRRYGASQ